MATTTTYRKVSSNVCKEGKSYRVRLQTKGVRSSFSFATKKAALEFRMKKLGF